MLMSWKNNKNNNHIKLKHLTYQATLIRYRSYDADVSYECVIYSVPNTKLDLWK